MSLGLRTNSFSIHCFPKSPIYLRIKFGASFTAKPKLLSRSYVKTSFLIFRIPRACQHSPRLEILLASDAKLKLPDINLFRRRSEDNYGSQLFLQFLSANFGKEHIVSRIRTVQLAIVALIELGKKENDSGESQITRVRLCKLYNRICFLPLYMA